MSTHSETEQRAMIDQLINKAAQAYADISKLWGNPGAQLTAQNEFLGRKKELLDLIFSPPVRAPLPESVVTVKQAVAAEQVRIAALLVEAMCNSGSNTIRDFVEPLLGQIAPAALPPQPEQGA